MTTDPAELLFERYLAEHGYEVLSYEVDLGTRKRPDYLIRVGGHEVVVEVESFNTQLRQPGPGGFVALPDLKVVRRKITAGAEQLKGIGKYPLVVLLVNPQRLPLPLASDQMIAAMYGNQVVTFTDDGLQWRTGRNGRLRVDEPDGSVRGNHPYLSAVAVLRCSYAEDAWATAWLRQRGTEYTNAVAAYAQALTRAERAGLHGEAVSLDVFETVSEAAVALPRVVFDGPTDTRWGKISEGQYGPLKPSR
ncbi:MAG: hypothetical protein ACRDQV_14175 [Pseudonocardiaceae bacterium]